MALSVTLHIGPPKTASTSVQRLLHAGYSRLLDSNTLYPDGDRSEQPHHRAAIDLCRELGLPPTVSRIYREVLAHQQWAQPGSWQALVRRTNEFPGHVILSCELFSELPATGVALIRRDFGDTPVTAVGVHRSPAKFLASFYQEDAKKMFMGDFESFAHTCVSVLSAQRDEAPVWADSAWLMRTWRNGGIPLRLVDASAGLTSRTVEEVVQLLAPGIEIPSEVSQLNESLSAWCIDTWQRYVRSAQPTYLGASMAALQRLKRVGDFATNAELGGHYRLTPEVELLVTMAFPGVTGEPDESARRELKSRLQSRQTLTERSIGTAEPDASATERILRDVHRWNLTASVKWRAADVVRRLQGGPSLTRNVWREPA